MVKNNFTKVEELLNQGLRKMSIEKLFNEAEASAQPKDNPNRNPGIAYSQSSEKENPEKLDKDQRQLINNLNRHLNFLRLEEHEGFYSQLSLKKSEIRKKVENCKNLTPEEWEQLKQIDDRMSRYKKIILENVSQNQNENIVENQRVKHINKRFNVNDNWLPLH